MKIDTECFAEEIVKKVVDALKPHLNGKGHAEDEIFDKKGLAAYLKVSVGLIDKLVSGKQIPYWKLSPTQSGGVRFSRKKIDEWMSRRNIPDVNPFR